MKRIIYLSFVMFVLSQGQMFSQEKGQFSGDLQLAGNAFIKDSTIGAFGLPQYEEQFVGMDAWFNLNYSYQGFDVGVRLDMFNNSNLKNPSGSYTAQGIGHWFVKKKLDKLQITIGHMYDQIGTGAIFRAYESRPLFIDQALVGVGLNYDLADNLKLKVLAGRQKNGFELYESFMKVASLDWFKSFESGLSIAPGIGFMNRTLSGDQMDNMIGILKGYVDSDRYLPKFNVYAATFYNNLSYKDFNWFIEAAYKSEDSFFDPNADRDLGNGSTSKGLFRGETGSFLYTSVGQSIGKFSVNVEYKRTENFELRTNPALQQFDGLMNYFPPASRQNTYQLTARYVPTSLFLGEEAVQVDLKYAVSRKLGFTLNYAQIDDLEGNPLYREIYTETSWKYKRKINLIGGIQLQRYNRQVYEQEGEGFLEAITPYVDVLYKIDRKKSIRVEASYMYTGADVFGHDFRDFGDWVFGLVEVGFAPHWILTASTMYNVSPQMKDSDGNFLEKINYPSLGAVYVNAGNRYGLRYVKQVEGVVCSGGICRLEPAFSGFRLDVSSTF